MPSAERPVPFPLAAAGFCPRREGRDPRSHLSPERAGPVPSASPPSPRTRAAWRGARHDPRDPRQQLPRTAPRLLGEGGASPRGPLGAAGGRSQGRAPPPTQPHPPRAGAARRGGPAGHGARPGPAGPALTCPPSPCGSGARRPTTSPGCPAGPPTWRCSCCCRCRRRCRCRSPRRRRWTRCCCCWSWRSWSCSPRRLRRRLRRPPGSRRGQGRRRRPLLPAAGAARCGAGAALRGRPMGSGGALTGSKAGQWAARGRAGRR